jgi:putative MATE family efflux protein
MTNDKNTPATIADATPADNPAGQSPAEGRGGGHGAIRGRLPLERLAADFGLLRGTIIKLAWPVAAEMFLHTLTQIVDMMMVARLGQAALAAVGISFRPMFFVMSIFLGVGAGTTALVARSMGAKQPEVAHKVAHQSVLATMVLATVLSAAFWAIAPWIQTFMGAEPAVAALGVSYMRSLAWGMVFMYMSSVATAALRGAGDTHTSMRVNIAANLVNVVLNYVLIFGHFGFPAMGVTGAAIATSISRVVGGVVIIGLILTRRLVIQPPKRLLSFDLEIFLRVVRIGVPAMVERMLLSLAMIFHLKMVAVAGTLAIAAGTLSQNIEELSHMPSIGISVSASTLVGQFLGHGRADAAEHSAWEAVKIALLFMSAMGMLFIAFPGVWLSIYAPDADLLPLASTLVRWMGVAQPFMAIAFVLSGALRGAGDTASVMKMTAFSMWVVRLGLTYIFMQYLGWGAPGAWAAMAVDNAVRAVMAVYIFRRGKWRRVDV